MAVDSAPAVVTITTTTSAPATKDPEDVPRLAGEVTIQSDTWDLTGTFDAAYCGPLTWGHECG